MTYPKVMLIFILIAIMSGAFAANNLRDGEKLVYDIKYGIVSAAEASLELNSMTFQGKPVWQIVSNSSTYSFFDVFFKVRDKVESLWEKDTLLPIRFTKRLNEGSYKQIRVHNYDHVSGRSLYQRWNFKRGKFTNKDIKIPKDTQDIFSAFYLVRIMDLMPGRNVVLNITADGKSIDTEIVVHRLETIDSIFGRKECLVIEPKMKGEAIFKQSGRIWIWITNDEYKVPLKMESEISFGSFVAILKSAENVPYRQQ
ncbi:MAG: hypothetical protein CVU48_04480 [Candidatus Cloacimonetes bacterium HGW-Cloacimonetes-1]|jgi:hypothetical protein|nr:MAG: hypothetical protein CVU48_04480 [Candidatus Cloacimonetes bacterium HGW-Cloacimonetes-1]